MALNGSEQPNIASMAMKTPKQLVDEFKKSGEFDRLRRELFTQFQQSEAVTPLLSRTTDIAKQRLNDDQRLQYMPPEAAHKELMQEIDRYPVIERAVSDVRPLQDPVFTKGIKDSLMRVQKDGDGKHAKDPKPAISGRNTAAKPSLPNGDTNFKISTPPSAATPSETVADGTSASPALPQTTIRPDIEAPSQVRVASPIKPDEPLDASTGDVLIATPIIDEPPQLNTTDHLPSSPEPEDTLIVSHVEPESSGPAPAASSRVSAPPDATLHSSAAHALSTDSEVDPPEAHRMSDHTLSRPDRPRRARSGRDCSNSEVGDLTSLDELTDRSDEEMDVK